MGHWFRDMQPCDVISVEDRGLQYSDGLFETIAIRRGRPRLWSLHAERLQTGCRRLAIDLPPEHELLDEVVSAISATDHASGDAILKIVVTRGEGKRGYAPSTDAKPTILIGVFERSTCPESHYQDGISIRFCDARMASQSQTAGIKLLARLDQVRARSEWDDPAVVEGLMLDQAGFVISGTISNLFIVRDRTLMTPEITQCGVSGVMRRHILALATEHGTNCELARLTPTEVLAADEIFLCNSQFGIWPVSSCGNFRKEDWPLTRNIRTLLRTSGVIEGSE